MNERRMQFRVGVVVFATMIVGGVLATLNAPQISGWVPWGRTTYRVAIKFDKAPGVDRHTPIHKNGILIGRVSKISDNDDHVLVEADINADNKLYDPYYIPTVRTSVIGDDATIDFDTQPVPPGTQSVPDGHVFIGQVEKSPFEAIADFASLKVEFEKAAGSLGEAGSEVKTLAANLNDMFGDETQDGRVDQLIATTERAMSQFEHTMTSINEIFGDVPAGAPQPAGVQRFDRPPPFNGGQPPVSRPPAQGQPPIEGQELRRRLRQGLYELPDVMHEARGTLKDAGDAINELRPVLRDFGPVLESAGRNFRNLEGFTEVLGQKGDVFAESILRLTSGLDALIRDFHVVVQAVNNREGTIGRLIHEPQTYENLNRLMCNANVVLGNVNDLTKRLQVVVEDARIFMDKIAREPGRVVTGGLNPSLTK